jgi:hypothetical protein
LPDDIWSRHYIGGLTGFFKPVRVFFSSQTPR